MLILEDHGVDMVFSGHNHCYEHFRVNGIDHIVTGGGGAPPYSIGAGPEEERDLLIQSHVFYHYVRLDVGPEELTVSVMGLDDDEPFETWTIRAER